MKKGILGDSGISISKLAFGTLPMGPLQLNVPLEAGADLIQRALDRGINFIDTAELYGTYHYIASAIKGKRDSAVIATKTHATDFNTAKSHVEKALREINTDMIDIFLIHATRDDNPFQSRRSVFDCLLEFKSKGMIRAVGVSTHRIDVVDKAADLDDIDIVFPLLNKQGLGIIDGTPSQMIKAIEKVKTKGKGIYIMKALAGGGMITNIRDNFRFVYEKECIDSVAVGMINEYELDINIRLFEGQHVSDTELKRARQRKNLKILWICKKCKKCIEECPNNALSMGNDTPEVDKSRCILCGYCTKACPELAIRVQ